MKQIFPVLMTLLLFIPAGCSKQEEITSYTVPKTDSGLGPAGSDSAMAPAKDVRMLAAILPDSPQYWFFKMTGAPEQVQAEFEPFVQFLKSVSLKDGKPEWKVPENWEQLPGNSMRFATLKVKGSDPAVELSVMPLPANSDLNEALLSNINRWRDQVGLGNITEAQLKAASDTPALDTELFTVKAGDQTMTVVSLKGKMAANPMGRAPFASGMMGGGAGRPAPGPSPANPPVAAAPSPVKFETPEGWKPGRSGGMRKAAFNITAGDETGEVTIIDLSKEYSPLLPNINRWRDQVGLKDITEAELPKESEQLKAGDLEATYVKLIGPETSKPAKAILGAILYRDNLAWFVKFTGPPKLAEQEQDRFKQFVQSIRFE
ncbi:hypothetical protein [uncultured Gimesia sp.]|uniref:hypothetical protein n=1 Tax=uncultured Gimesia sp. TaxID=1678688 RepID=UPI0030DCEC0E